MFLIGNFFFLKMLSEIIAVLKSLSIASVLLCLYNMLTKFVNSNERNMSEKDQVRWTWLVLRGCFYLLTYTYVTELFPKHPIN